MKIEIKQNKKITIEDVCLVAENKAEVVIGNDVLQKVKENCEQVQQIISQDIYGLTTGVADLSMQKPTQSPDETQKNILLSHSVGVGEFLPKNVVRALIFSRLITLSQGMSGVSKELLIFLTEILNKNVVPLVPSLGSIGLSDLTILAGSFVILCNKGKVMYKGQTMTPFEAFKKAKIKYPKTLKTREGLALINGNNATIALSCLLIKKMESVLSLYIQTASLSLEARGGTYSIYNPTNQLLRPFIGQKIAAEKLEEFLQGSSQIATLYKNTKTLFLQDPPSFKTVAQIAGNVFDELDNAKKIISIELNSISDNPVFVEKNGKTEPVSSGNYLCAQLATMLDLLSLTLSSLAASSSSRIKILVNENYNEGLPQYLISDNANNTGFMICVYTAESLLAELQSLLYPRSAFGIIVANGWEDVSTNAFNAALNTQKVLVLTREVLFFELALAIQGMSLRKKQKKIVKYGKITAEIFKKIILFLKPLSLPIKKDAFIASFLKKIRESEEIIWNQQ